MYNIYSVNILTMFPLLMKRIAQMVDNVLISMHRRIQIKIYKLKQAKKFCHIKANYHSFADCGYVQHCKLNKYKYYNLSLASERLGKWKFVSFPV